MNADGTGQIQLTNHSENVSFPNWSPDGTKIAFRDRVVQTDVFEVIVVMNADGTGITQLTPNRADSFLSDPNWSPDGSKIAFSGFGFGFGSGGILVMNADGSGLTLVTPNLGFLSWSPDGKKILTLDYGGNAIATINADGTDFTRIAFTPPNDFFFITSFNADWSAVPGSTQLALKIDIDPRKFPNQVEANGDEPIDVAILSTGPGNINSFDATKVKPATVRFGKIGTEAIPKSFKLVDINRDGFKDMVFNFRTSKTGIKCGDKTAKLIGKTVKGRVIFGIDSIKVVGCR